MVLRIGEAAPLGRRFGKKNAHQPHSSQRKRPISEVMSRHNYMLGRFAADINKCFQNHSSLLFWVIKKPPHDSVTVKGYKCKKRHPIAIPFSVVHLQGLFLPLSLAFDRLRSAAAASSSTGCAAALFSPPRCFIIAKNGILRYRFLWYTFRGSNPGHPD